MSIRADFIFLLDFSGSVGDDFDRIIVPFISTFANSVKLGLDNVLIGVATSDKTYFTLNTYTDKKDLVNATKGIQ